MCDSYCARFRGPGSRRGRCHRRGQTNPSGVHPERTRVWLTCDAIGFLAASTNEPRARRRPSEPGCGGTCGRTIHERTRTRGGIRTNSPCGGIPRAKPSVREPNEPERGEIQSNPRDRWFSTDHGFGRAGIGGLRGSAGDAVDRGLPARHQPAAGRASRMLSRAAEARASPAKAPLAVKGAATT